MLATFPSLLGVMELSGNNYSWSDLGNLTIVWVQDAGGFAAVGLLLWVLYVLFAPAPAIAGRRRRLISGFMAVTGSLALILYLIAIGLGFIVRADDQKWAEQFAALRSANPQAQVPARPTTNIDQYHAYAMTVGGLLALLAFAQPFVLDLGGLSRRRIWAIARLSFKEAVRRRVLWVLFLFAIVFLFPATWFYFKKVKPEDVLKTNIDVISYAMTFLLCLMAGLLSAFSIPSDIKNLTIHTIVTKPVERFEIVAGRFLGYAGLMTLATFVLTSVSLVLIMTSNIDEAARAESMKARAPVYGRLDLVQEKVENRQLLTRSFAGIDVGREYAYRRYIAGGSASQRAVWNFVEPGELKSFADREAVPLEFAFDCFRMTKGEENIGVKCSFDLVTWRWDLAREEEYQNEVRAAFGSYPANIRYRNEPNTAERLKESWRKIGEIAQKYGRFEFRGLEVYDYHTYQLMIPPGLIRNALEGDPGKNYPIRTDRGPVRLQIKVKCESPSQYIGVAPLDLYFLDSEGVFWWNFVKSSLGLLCRLCIVIGLAVAVSTYLAGVVSFLLAGVLFLGGYFQEFLQSLADGTNVGGGPLESLTRLVKGSVVAAELDKTPSVQAALFGDDLFRWLLRRLLDVIPDPERFTWSKYLAQGFNIPIDFMLLNVLFLAAYLAPWMLMAYYLMRSREIAA